MLRTRLVVIAERIFILPEGGSAEGRVLHGCVNISSASRDDRGRRKRITALAFHLLSTFYLRAQLMLCLACTHLCSMTPRRGKISVITFTQAFHNGAMKLQVGSDKGFE